MPYLLTRHECKPPYPWADGVTWRCSEEPCGKGLARLAAGQPGQREVVPLRLGRALAVRRGEGVLVTDDLATRLLAAIQRKEHVAAAESGESA